MNTREIQEMPITAVFEKIPAEPAGMAMEYVEPRWYAVYTRSRHEKSIAQQCERSMVESFLPIYESVRRWKDRRVRLDLPLFPGYVFVHIALKDRLKVQQISGVVRLVGFDGLPTALPDSEMEALRAALQSRLHAEPHPYLRVGQRVILVRGPLKGLEGILIRKKGALRVVLSLDLIMRSAAVDVDSADVQRLR